MIIENIINFDLTLLLLNLKKILIAMKETAKNITEYVVFVCPECKKQLENKPELKNDFLNRYFEKMIIDEYNKVLK